LTVRLAFLLYKYFPYGGMQRDFRRFVQELQQRGHDCRVYCISWQGELLPEVDVRRVPVRGVSNIRRYECFHARVEDDLKANPVDGVIGFNRMPGLDIYYAADPCFIDKALKERSWLYRLGSRYRHFSRCERAIFGAASDTEILLIAESQRHKFEQYYHTPAARMHLLPAGVSPDRRAPTDAPGQRQQARASLGLVAADHVLLLAGSGFVTKGLDRAICAVAALRGKTGERTLRLLVVGQDREDRFRRLARRQGVAGQVSFLGGRDDMPQLLLAADVLVHPARAEAAGIILLEAVVAGLPVITTEVCGYAHHIAAANAGVVLAEPFVQAALDRALASSLVPGNQRQWQQGALAYAQARDLYSMHSTGAIAIENIVARQVAKRAASTMGAASE
jgi:UDP-glucose:(heptosyl)LPS alpha-1,3-glucosyltransferase